MMDYFKFGSITFLMCNLCSASGVDRRYLNETLTIESINNLQKTANILNDATYKNIESRNYNNKIIKRSANFTEDLINDEFLELNVNKTKTTNNEMDASKGNETKEVTSDEDSTTEFYDQYNYTEEPCVGDPEFCNMTKEEYLLMLYDYIYPQPYEWVLIATHAIVFVIGLIGNALVCIAVYRNHSMRTVTNYFIVNLAVADFMVILICLPPTVLWDVTETWFFGTAMCRIVLYFQVSVLF